MGQKGWGDGGDQGFDVVLDELNDCYVTGFFDERASFGSHNAIGSDGLEIFVAKYSSIGESQWVNRAGGQSTDWATSLAIGTDGSLYVTGFFLQNAFFGVNGPNQASLNAVDRADIFLAKYKNVVTTGISQDNDFLTDYRLHQNYPNPFNPSTVIEFSIPENQFVTIKVFNMKGAEVATLITKDVVAGTHSFEWEPTGLASGVYFYRIQAGNFVRGRKLILLK